MGYFSGCFSGYVFWNIFNNSFWKIIFINSECISVVVLKDLYEKVPAFLSIKYFVPGQVIDDTVSFYDPFNGILKKK